MPVSRKDSTCFSDTYFETDVQDVDAFENHSPSLLCLYVHACMAALCYLDMLIAIYSSELVVGGVSVERMKTWVGFIICIYVPFHGLYEFVFCMFILKQTVGIELT